MANVLSCPLLSPLSVNMKCLTSFRLTGKGGLGWWHKAIHLHSWAPSLLKNQCWKTVVQKSTDRWQVWKMLGKQPVMLNFCISQNLYSRWQSYKRRNVYGSQLLMDHEGRREDKYSLDKIKSNGKVFLAQQHFEGVVLRKQIPDGLAFGSAKQSTRGNQGRPFHPSFHWRQNCVDV